MGDDIISNLTALYLNSNAALEEETHNITV